MVEMLVPLIVTRSVVAAATEPVVNAVPSSVDARGDDDRDQDRRK